MQDQSFESDSLGGIGIERSSSWTAIEAPNIFGDQATETANDACRHVLQLSSHLSNFLAELVAHITLRKLCLVPKLQVTLKYRPHDAKECTESTTLLAPCLAEGLVLVK